MLDIRIPNLSGLQQVRLLISLYIGKVNLTTQVVGGLGHLTGGQTLLSLLEEY